MSFVILCSAERDHLRSKVCLHSRANFPKLGKFERSITRSGVLLIVACKPVTRGGDGAAIPANSKGAPKSIPKLSDQILGW